MGTVSENVTSLVVVRASSFWTSGSSSWSNGWTYNQGIDLSLIPSNWQSNKITMNGSVMNISDASPSSTFASAHFNIFSNDTNPLVDGLVPCAHPFSYLYAGTHPVYVLWCPLSGQGTN